MSIQANPVVLTTKNHGVDSSDERDPQLTVYATGDIITFHATKLLPFGIAGTLPNGEWGIVREREISWDKRQLRQWRRNFVLNQDYQVLVLEKRPEHWEVSLRFAASDPWVHVTDRYRVSQLVDGTVTRFWDNAAVVELEPGITGVLRRDALPDWTTQPIDDLLWVGDRVRASIERIEPTQRTVVLTMKPVAARRWQDYAFQAVETSAKSQPYQHRVAPQDPPSVISSAAWGINSILVIEDDDPQREALCRWLRNENQQVYHAESADRGLTLFAQHPINTVICDLGLSSERDGIAVLQEVMHHERDVRCILVTDWASAEQRHAEIRALEQRGVVFLIKPVLPEELAVVLANEHRPLQKSGAVGGHKEQKNTLAITSKRKQRLTVRNLQQTLDHLRQTTRATKVLLFAFDPQTRAIEIVGQSGPGRVHEDALAKLIYSPVRDVAEDEVIVQIEDVTKQSAYARYLTPLLRFRSAVGIPVILNQTLRYALMLFHTAPGLVGHVVLQEAGATAMQISALLEKQFALEQMAEMQRTVLLGNLSRALIHETNNQLNPILFDLSDLQRSCARVHRSLEMNLSSAHEQLDETQTMVTRLTESIHKLVRTTRMFGRVTIQDRDDLVRVDQVAEECIGLVRDLAERSKINVRFHAPPQSLITLAKFTQVQQVLLNLLLNAVQQLAISREETGGTIHLWFAVEPDADGIETIRVFVEDDGPGIHRQLHERVFELGMTTRQGEGGSGMGLFVSQRLIESAGGHLYIDESIPLWGTRMVAEFPVYIAQQKR